MNPDSTTTVSWLIMSGLSLVILGVVQLGIGEASLRLKLLVNLALASLCCVGVHQVVSTLTTADLAGMWAVLVGLSCTLQGQILPRSLALLASLATTGSVRMAGLASVGLTTALGSAIWCDQVDQSEKDRSMEILANYNYRPVLATSDSAQFFTDLGNPISSKIPTKLRAADEVASVESKYLSQSQLDRWTIRRSPPDDRSNCHGWTFARGEFWITGKDIEMLLWQNQYTLQTNPEPGDLIVYRNGASIDHTGVVRYVTPNEPVLVESKWGTYGVYLHPAERSPYGHEFAFYRSPRQGHQLVSSLVTRVVQEYQRIEND